MGIPIRLHVHISGAFHSVEHTGVMLGMWTRSMKMSSHHGTFNHTLKVQRLDSPQLMAGDHPGSASKEQHAR